MRVDRVREHFDADQIRSVRAFVCELFACSRRCLCDLTCLFSVFIQRVITHHWKHV